MHDILADEALMRQVQQGAVGQAGLLFERYHRQLYGFFFHMTHNRLASEDLVQDVFLRLIKYRSAYSSERPFKPWLFGMARNVLYDSQKRQLSSTDTVPPDIAAPWLDEIELQEQRDQLYRALNQIPEQQREVLVLSHVTDLTYAEIAKCYEIKVNAVRVRVFRALKALRAIYLQHDNESR